MPLQPDTLIMFGRQRIYENMTKNVSSNFSHRDFFFFKCLCRIFVGYDHDNYNGLFSLNKKTIFNIFICSYNTHYYRNNFKCM